jgi:hypothetical protein
MQLDRERQERLLEVLVSQDAPTASQGRGVLARSSRPGR